MAIKAWFDIPSGANNPAALLYELYQRITAASTSFPGRLAILDSSPGSGGSWDSAADIGEGAWMVVECQRPWGDGSKWQVLLGVRKSATGTIAGYTSNNLAVNLWALLSWSGGWNSTTKVFDAAIISGWKGICSGTWNTATVSSIAILDVVQGSNQQAGLLAYGRNSNGTINIGLYVGGFFPFVSYVGKPAVLFASEPNWTNGSGAWGYGTATGSRGSILNGSETAAIAAFIHNDAVPMWAYGALLTLHSGEPAGVPLIIYGHDGTAARAAGWFPEVYRTDASVANWTRNADNTRVVVNGLIFPAGDVA